MHVSAYHTIALIRGTRAHGRGLVNHRTRTGNSGGDGAMPRRPLTRRVYTCIYTNMTEAIPTAKCQQVAQYCAGYGVRRAARAVAGLYNEVLAPTGLKGTQFTLINAIAVAGRPTITHLAELLLMDRTTLTRNLKPLAQRGLVRIASGQDRRAKELTLTPDGVNILRRALPLWDRAQNAVTTRLGRKRLARLRSDLAELEQFVTAR